MLYRAEVRSAQRKLAGRRQHLAADRPDPSRPEGTDCLPQIKHIVVLMMENHSYDNYFGMMNGRGDGLTRGPGGQPSAINFDSKGRPVRLQPFAGPKTRTGTSQYSSVPTQTWNASHIQWNNGACDGFVRSVEQTLPSTVDPSIAMRYFTESDLPFYYGLARTFPLATRWFCSCLGPTFPNRRFLLAGTAHGLIDDLPFGMGDYPEAGTIFDLLSANRISWANYHHAVPFQINFGPSRGSWWNVLLGWVSAFFSKLLPAATTYGKGKLQTTATLYPLGLLKASNHLKTIDRFFADARAGTLPAFSIVDPDFGIWSEENPQDVQSGEAFSARIINAVMSGPGWSDTLLIWLYDEHGGYYDHVNPPAAVAPDDVAAGDPVTRSWLSRFILGLTPYAKQIATINAGPKTYTNYGFRVPAVIVSPYAKPDYVSSTIYDHTSILKLVEMKWNLPSLTRRDAAATPPLDALDFSKPTFLKPPLLPPSAITIDL
jgi:phospholipase C